MNKIKQQLKNVYGESITIRIGTSQNVSYDIGNKIENVDIAIYIHSGYKIAILWNISSRREVKSFSHVLSFSKDWKDIVPKKEDIGVYYKIFWAGKQQYYEKVLVMHIDTLRSEMFNLPDLLSEDIYDNEYPDKNKKENYIPSARERKRITTSRWKREKAFRSLVLNAYENRCAICRCDEERILQAAHIIAVEDGGKDELANGICLCANHHLMLDNDLIEIDYTNLNLKFVAPSVQKMVWYNEFITTHKGKLISKK